LESDVRDLLSEMKITADLRHITDLKEIARYGVMGAPALVVNNKVVSARRSAAEKQNPPMDN